MSRLSSVLLLCVLSEMGDEFVVGICAYSKGTCATGYFLRHVSSAFYKS